MNTLIKRALHVEDLYEQMLMAYNTRSSISVYRRKNRRYYDAQRRFQLSTGVSSSSYLIRQRYF